jgi:hypothetical protein
MKISDFRCGVDEGVVFLEFYTELVGSYWTFRDSLPVPSSKVFLDCLTLEDGKERLSRNVGN